MIRGLYTTASAVRAQEIRLGMLMNNLANVNTTGFKGDKVAYHGFQKMAISRLMSASTDFPLEEELGPLPVSTAAVLSTGAPAIDLMDGPLIETERTLDIALRGPGFLVVQTADGERYTRNGSLRIDADGLLTLADGSPVLGVDGPVRIEENHPDALRIEADGSIFVGNQQIARLRLVEIAPEGLRKVGDTYFEATDAGFVREAQGTTVSQGFLEGSNVDATSTMVELLSLVRSYTVSLEYLRLQDEALGRAVGEIARFA